MGPILLNNYINGVFSRNSCGLVFGFADDATILYEWDNFKIKVESDFSSIFEKWFEYKLLTVYTEKTNYLPFRCSSGLPNFISIEINTGST